MAQQGRSLRLYDLSGDAWRLIGDFIGLLGLQRLRETGSRALRLTLSRVIFRTLRGSLLPDDRGVSTLRDVALRMGLCLELQAEEVEYSLSTENLILPSLHGTSVYHYLIALLFTPPSARSACLDLDMNELKAIPWIRLLNYFQRISLRRKTPLRSISALTSALSDAPIGPSQDIVAPSVIDSRTVVVTLSSFSYDSEDLLSLLEGVSFLSGSQISTWSHLSDARFAPVSFFSTLPLLETLVLDILEFSGERHFDLSSASSLKSFKICLMPNSSRDVPRNSVSITCSQHLTAIIAIYCPTANSQTIRPLELHIKGTSNLRSLTASCLHWGAFWRIHRSALSDSLEELDLIESCLGEDAWNVDWPPKLKKLRLVDAWSDHTFVDSFSWHQAHEGMEEGNRKVYCLDPLALPSTLEYLEYRRTWAALHTTLPPIESNLEHGVVKTWRIDTERFFVEKRSKQMANFMPVLKPLDGLLVELSICYATLDYQILPCPNLKVLLLANGVVDDLNLLPPSLTALTITGDLKGRPTYSKPKQCFELLFPRARKLLQGSNSTNQADSFSLLPELRSCEITLGSQKMWPFLLPLNQVEDILSDLQSSSVVHGERKTIDLAHWLLRSICVVIGLPAGFDTDTSLSAYERAKTFHIYWDSALTPSDDRDYYWIPTLDLPSQISSIIWYARGMDDEMHLTVADSDSDDSIDPKICVVYDECSPHFQSYPSIAAAFNTSIVACEASGSHIQRLELRSVTAEWLTFLTLDWSSFTSLRWLLLSSKQTSNSRTGLLDFDRLCMPQLLELIVFLPYGWLTVKDSMRPMPLLKRLIICQSLSEAQVSMIRANSPQMESLEIVPHLPSQTTPSASKRRAVNRQRLKRSNIADSSSDASSASSESEKASSSQAKRQVQEMEN